MKPIKYTGDWWLPEEPDKVLKGTLVGDGISRPTLDLFGLFREMDTSVFQPDIILGHAADGTLLTLCNCLRTRNDVFGAGNSAFEAAVVLSGQHFATMDSIRFSSVGVNLQHLNQWTGLDNVHIAPVMKTADHPPGFDLTLRAKHPLKVTAGDFELEFSVDSDFEIKRGIRYAITLTHWLTLTPKTPVNLEECFEMIRSAQTFVALGLAWPTQPEDVRCRTAEFDAAKDAVHLHYAVEASRHASRPVELANDRCFYCGDIADTIGEHFGTWLAMPAGLRTVRDLFFSRRYATSIFREHDFLTLAQAVESFHRETRGGTYMKPAQRKAVLRALKKTLAEPALAVDPKVQHVLGAERLAFMHEHTLRTRLESLLEEFKEFCDIFIPDGKAFVRSVLLTRNYWTHYDAKSAAKQLDDYAAYVMTKRLDTLMEICWMAHVRIPKKVIEAVALRCKNDIATSDGLQRAARAGSPVVPVVEDAGESVTETT